MLRIVYGSVGVLALALGLAGIFLPLLPTVPFALLAAFCFARSNERWERWLIEHRHFGPHILAWRERGAISRKGKIAATVAFAVSALIGLATLPLPWGAIPIIVAVAGGSWVLTRPEF